MKRFVWLVLAAISVMGAAGGTYLATSRYIRSATPESSKVGCQKADTVHVVVIQNGKLNTNDVRGHICDRLTITNEDDRLRLMAFGAHSHHQAYDGITEEVLSQGQSLSVVMDRVGRYTFHDHLDDSVKGTFTVSE